MDVRHFNATTICASAGETGEERLGSTYADAVPRMPTSGAR